MLVRLAARSYLADLNIFVHEPPYLCGPVQHAQPGNAGLTRIICDHDIPACDHKARKSAESCRYRAIREL